MFDWQFLDPSSEEVKTFTRPKNSFRYLSEYTLKCEGTVACGTGNMLVEWFFKEDRYVVQCINVPLASFNKRKILRVSASVNDHYINPRKVLLLLFEIYKDHRGICARVRHVPTFVEFRGWSNSKIPKMACIRKGHKRELSDFLETNFQACENKTDNPFDKILLDRIEKPITSW